MENQIGFNALMAFVMSMTFYSGAGQFMIAGMTLGGSPLLSVIASVSFVNTRQLLYSAAFSPFFTEARKRLTFLFSATVTDESFGVNFSQFMKGSGAWTPSQATLVNLFCMTSWGVSNAIGVLVGSALTIPTAIASFAMTSIFICLLVSQKIDAVSLPVIIVSACAVCLCKLIGLGGAAIMIGACIGVAAGMVIKGLSHREH
ncbi:MAG: AzlC family ABC transporter permease [Eggerthellaceae bacterium]|jgi:4-azaleucine resistance transporter AzlC|nr:AzlC family ABC transporter permease [Eggerthellaceae bacterium]MCH4221250.1 AzlC family ABC transporter permease [Eggerthellaceae bacterium]